MRITWHGHACHHIETKAGQSILVDPFLENGLTERRVEDFSPDLILITHGHGDHTGSVLSFPDAHVVSNYEIGQWLAKNGVAHRTAMNVGGFARPIDGVRVWMAPATHSSGLDAALLSNGTLSNGGSPCGYVIDDGETRLYLAGDTGLFGDMRDVIRDVLAPHVAVLPIGDLFTMGPEHAAIAADWLGVQVVTPCHYDTFAPIKQDPHAFAQLVRAGIDVRVLEVDGSFEVVGGKVI